MLNKPKTEQKSSVYQQRISVPFEYHVWFTHHLFEPNNPVLRDTLTRLESNKRHRILTFVDQGVVENQPELVDKICRYADAHRDVLELVRRPVAIDGGERIKVDLKCVERMQQIVFEDHIDRHSFIIGIGGGAVLDAVGWVAATAHRGVRHIRVPTTVLAQNDSGVGVKNGVNKFGVKNYMGSFSPPFAVLNDLEFIMSLPHRDQIAGIAEAVKVALIRDADFFDWLERNADKLVSIDPEATEYMIRRCAELHMNQIANGGDPFEMGSARPLDYGHWSAHKIESLTNYEIRHGEAVAIGLVLDAKYSVIEGLLPDGEEIRVHNLLVALGFDLWHPVLEKLDNSGVPVVLNGLHDFKEHLGGELCVTLLKEIGVGIEVNEMDSESVSAAINWLKAKA
ncbi:MAG: 3-dehydroquinate synthase [Planctomycetota bacterium]